MNRPSFTWKLYIAAFYLFLFAPLLVVAIFAFNASQFPSPPWRGFTLEWFTGTGAVLGKPGVLMDPIWLSSIGNSFKVAIPVALLAVLVGTVNAWVLERARVSRQDALLAMMMLWPLVIPGVVLGISILAFFSRVANGLEDWLQTDLDLLRPGLPLVVLGQLSFILTIATLIIAARLRKFDRSLEEAAFDLGASRARVLRTVTLAVPAPGAHRRRARGAPDVVRELQHDPDARRLRIAAADRHVRPDARGRVAGDQCGEPAADARRRRHRERLRADGEGGAVKPPPPCGEE